MGYVDKKTALKYLANSEVIFNKVKTTFLNEYQTGVEEIYQIYNNHDMIELHRFIHSLKGIALNIGSQVLYDDSIHLIELIKKEAVKLPDIDQFIYTFRNVYEELSKL